MKKRRPARLFICALEAIRSAAAYLALLPLLAQDTISSGRFAAAAVFAPQLILPVAWFLIWYDARSFRHFSKLIAVAKILALIAQIPWLAVLVSGARVRFMVDRIAFLSDASRQGLFLFADIALLAAALIVGRADSVLAEPDRETGGASYSGPERIDAAESGGSAAASREEG